jgi:type I restriction enzyme R subunit
MRNFDFLKDNVDFAPLYLFCNDAEINQSSDPNKSALSSRLALEYLVKTVYLLRQMEVSEKASLFELVDGEVFKAFVGDDKLMMALHYIRKAGNNAAHTANVTKKESFFCLLNLHAFTGAVLLKLGAMDSYPPFNKELLSSKPEVHIAPPTKAVPSSEVISNYAGKIDKKDTLIVRNPEYFTEAETRKFYIDQQLREAGWEVLDTENSKVPGKAGIEIRVEGMPNTKEEGFADYVLYGRDGSPLAVVEAKKTSHSPIKGKHQATLYADCLEKQYGIRPVVYYTNGYELNIIDGLGYPNRRLLGFHTIAELELLIQRKSRQDIHDFQINESIAGRYYQKTAVTAVCEHFNNKHRRALLVMATGTGKTRVSISLVELLMRNNWIKNVLFLADRTALVGQAKKNFAKLLPHVPVCVLSDNDTDKDMNARIIFSTYQTMINYIDKDTKDFTIGRFDLIIIDEAHRSIFGKYTAIFDYFDSLLVGLTATPRSEVDRSTYEMFEMEQGVPNFDYELEEAVADKFLVPYRGIIRHSKHLQAGIKYKDLSFEEKEQLEKVWDYEAAKNALDGNECKRDIRGEELFSYIFNQDTIDKVLQDLMTNGLKVQSGERIGKTVIFAYNHAHAELITERFKTLYPQYGAEYCVLIDNYVTYAHDLIDRFEVRDKDPQIAVSVDMLDTGIDVPDILNLVFFKIVRSKIKFLQMIGRGTRLSEGVFGEHQDKEDQDKKEFYIFDFCENFDYFDKNPNGSVLTTTQSLTERIFNIKADIAFELQALRFQEDDFAKEYHLQTKKELREQIGTLNTQRIDVRKNLLYVDKYKLETVWQYISKLDVLEIKNRISYLLTPTQEDENAKRFDMMVLIIELSILDKLTNPIKTKQKIVTIAEILQDKTTIPQVKEKIEVIKELLTENFWKNLSLSGLERIRIELRDLMKFLVGDKKATFTVDIEDEIVDGGIAAGIVIVTTYKQRVFDYLLNNRATNTVLQKILMIEKLDRSDLLELENILWKELGTKEEYDNYTQNRFSEGNVAIFLRSMIGVNRDVAADRFSKFLDENTLNSQQQEYVKTIVNYVCENGDITREVIANESPFDGFDWLQVFGNHVNVIPRYVDELHGVVVV